MNFGGTIRLNGLGIFIVLALFTFFLLYLTKFSVKEVREEKEADVNLRKLLIAAVEAAEEGGKQIITVKNAFNIVEHSKGKTKEGANDPVTNADYLSHCVMYTGLQEAFPTVTVISEESDTECGENIPFKLMPTVERGLDVLVDQFVPGEDLAVWIDPLDATQEFTENLLNYVSTMVCVAYKGEPIIGVIHKPFGEEPRTTWAWVKKAHSPNLDIHRQTKSTPTIIVSRTHAGRVSEIATEAIGNEVKVVSAGGAGYKVLEVVSGNATAYVHSTKIKKWDICAGNAILNELGGHMTTLLNEKLDYSRSAEQSNSLGLLVTMDRHDWYASKFKNVQL
ncbi:putative inositol monophosphatase 3 [Lycorma delicatula]|uniref:putative inositol monophosphatase 3 n=1 Tax=Lycorma delicatula TaxID=130591 RepID=UPI003F50E656